MHTGPHEGKSKQDIKIFQDVTYTSKKPDES